MRAIRYIEGDMTGLPISYRFPTASQLPECFECPGRLLLVPPRGLELLRSVAMEVRDVLDSVFEAVARLPAPVCRRRMRARG